MRLRARLRSRACSTLMSSQMTGTSVRPDPACRDEPLVATDDDRVLTAGEHRLDDAPLAHRAGEGLQLLAR